MSFRSSLFPLGRGEADHSGRGVNERRDRCPLRHGDLQGDDQRCRTPQQLSHVQPGRANLHLSVRGAER